MPFRFRKFDGSREHVPAMHHVKDTVATANLIYNTGMKGRIIPWSSSFVSWESDKYIAEELYKSVGFSFLCVLGTTFLLLSNIRVCFFCGVSVVFTLINVGGMMHFWGKNNKLNFSKWRKCYKVCDWISGLTIDMISFIDIVLAVGLCVGKLEPTVERESLIYPMSWFSRLCCPHRYS